MGDKYNRRHVILASLLVFVIGSVACAFACNFSLLLVGRFLQGIGMAGPAVLGYVVVMDDYPPEKRPAIMGSLNGLVTLSMAFAPLVGSYVNLYFGWRANFLILLIISIICLVGGYFTILSKPGDKTISLSPTAYLEILSSRKVMQLILGISFLSVSYWTFVSMSPIIYMEAMGVKLEHFGFYQGSVCAMFSIVSICSTRIYDKLGQKNCLYAGVIACALCGAIFLLLGLCNVKNPMVITAIMLIFAVAAVFPSNVLYPYALNMLDNSSGRVAALINGLRLLLTAIAIEIISYYYADNFLPLGISMFICVFISSFFMRLAMRKIKFSC